MVEDADRLGRLPRRHVVRGNVARAESELDVDAVDAGDRRVGDDLDRPCSRYELSQAFDAPHADVDSCCRENDAVGVVRGRVAGLLVDRQALAVERVECLLVDGQRAVAARDSRPRDRRLDVEQDGEGASTESFARGRRQHGATSERDHDRLAGSEYRPRHRLFELSEGSLAVAGEELLDRDTGPALDLAIEIDEVAAEAPGDPRADRRLARAHEAGQREVSVQSVRGQRMRSR